MIYILCLINVCRDACVITYVMIFYSTLRLATFFSGFFYFILNTWLVIVIRSGHFLRWTYNCFNIKVVSNNKNLRQHLWQYDVNIKYVKHYSKRSAIMCRNYFCRRTQTNNFLLNSFVSKQPSNNGQQR